MRVLISHFDVAQHVVRLGNMSREGICKIKIYSLNKRFRLEASIGVEPG